MKQDLTERTFKFSLAVIEISAIAEKQSTASMIIVKQLIRSATSVGANIEEGQAAQSKADFLTKCSIACKEARETHYWLRLLEALKLGDSGKLKSLLQECNELVAILTTICRKIKGN